MKVFILVLVVCLAVSAVHGKKKPSKAKPSKPQKPAKEEEKDGMCIDGEKMMKMCLAGSSLGEKSPAAMETCDAQIGNERSLGLMRAKKPKGKGKGKGKGKPNKKCPTADEIMQLVSEKYSWELCMFSEVGWIDNDMVPQEDIITADIATLPGEMSEALLGDEFDQCVADLEEKAFGYSKCISKYSDEEVQALSAVLNGIARTECFFSISEKSCGEYVNNIVDALAGEGNSGEIS